MSLLSHIYLLLFLACPLERIQRIVQLLTTEYRQCDQDARAAYWDVTVLHRWYTKVTHGYDYPPYDAAFVNKNGAVGGWDMRPFAQKQPSITRYQKEQLPSTTSDVS
jgi:hypothetical protein